MIFKSNKKGAQGIGTLIIFIAIILVAAVAAGVLIQTASSLQSKSLDVGRQSQEKITTDLDVIQVYVTDTSDGNITSARDARAGDTITMVLRLGSGSVPVKIQDLLLRFDAQDGSQTVTYSGSSAFTNETFGIDYKINGSNNQAGYLGTGDLAEINFVYLAVSDIVEGQTATLRLVAKNGAVKPIQITTPSAMLDTITYLYP